MNFFVGVSTLLFLTMVAAHANLSVLSRAAVRSGGTFRRAAVVAAKISGPSLASATELHRNFPPRPMHTATGVPYGESLLVGNTNSPTGLVTFMHGLGESARDWKAVASELSERLPSLLFLLPTAPKRPVTWISGAMMPAWYDIVEAPPMPAEGIDADIKEAAAFMHSISESVGKEHGIADTNVVYGGFSQGAVVSIFAGLTAPARPKGILAMSGYLAGREVLSKSAKYKTVPILVAHGDADDMVPIQQSYDTVEELKKVIGVEPTAITHEVYALLRHFYCQSELVDVYHWLSNLEWDV